MEGRRKRGNSAETLPMNEGNEDNSNSDGTNASTEAQRRAKAGGQDFDAGRGILPPYHTICASESPSLSHTQLRLGVLQSWGLAHRTSFLTDMRHLQIGSELRRLRLCLDIALARPLLLLPHTHTHTQATQPQVLFAGPIDPHTLDVIAWAEAAETHAHAQLLPITARLFAYFVRFFVGDYQAQTDLADRLVGAAMQEATVAIQRPLPVSLRVVRFPSASVNPDFVQIGCLREAPEIDPAPEAVWVCLEMSPAGHVVIVPPFRY